jgi:anti-anti-sigma factor
MEGSVEISTSIKARMGIIQLSGPSVMGDDKKISEAARDMAVNGYNIALDITKLSFISSAGIASVLPLIKVADENKCQLVIYGNNQGLLMMLDKVFSHNYIPVITEDEFRTQYLS